MTKLEKNGLNGISKKPSLFNHLTEKTTEEPLEIICDGDSWVFGCEIVDPALQEKYGKDLFPGYYDFEEANDAYRRTKIFSYHLSKIFNCKVTNLSWPADDNGSILRRTMEYVTSEYIARGRSTKNLLVMIGWSSPERNSFWYKDDKLSHLFRLWPQVRHFDAPAQEEFWKLYVTYLWNPEEYIVRYVMNVVQFQNFCKAHDISWMCWNSFYQTPGKNPQDWNDLDIRQELNAIAGATGGYQYQVTTNPTQRNQHVNNYANLWDTIDPVRFYKKDQPCSTFKSYVEQPDLNIKQVLNGWHPGPDSHEAWAKELARYIKEHKLIK